MRMETEQPIIEVRDLVKDFGSLDLLQNNERG